MSWIAVGVAGATLVGGVYSSKKQGEAAKDAAGQQSQSAELGIAEQRRQFDAIQELLKPYVTAGTGALGQQQNLAGTNGADAQRAAIDAISRSPELAALTRQGEDAILQNASATGGLRGGNVQGALGQFRPAMLSAAINDQYSRLGGLASMGLGAATNTGQFGQASTNNVTQLLQQQGSALAGGILGQGRAQAGYANAITGAIGAFGGLYRPAGGSGGGGSWGSQFQNIPFGGQGGGL
jgi:hypothetical protein